MVFLCLLVYFRKNQPPFFLPLFNSEVQPPENDNGKTPTSFIVQSGRWDGVCPIGGVVRVF